jgi:hypothetical protein
MARVRVQVVEEVKLEKPQYGGWVLCLQWCRYVYDNGKMERGFRFIWRRPRIGAQQKGALQPARGQARITKLEDAETLIAMARNEGWGNEIGDD